MPTRALPPEGGGRSILLSVAEILASEMDMSSLSVIAVTNKHYRPKYLSLKIHCTHEKERTVAQGFFFGGIFW